MKIGFQWAGKKGKIRRHPGVVPRFPLSRLALLLFRWTTLD